MAGKRSMFFFGLMLFLLSTPGYGATLQYASGAFAVTPYIYGKITDTACGPPDPPVMEEYNPGPLYNFGQRKHEYFILLWRGQWSGLLEYWSHLWKDIFPKR